MTKYLQTAGAVAFFGPLVLASAVFVVGALWAIVYGWNDLEATDVMDAAAIAGFFAAGGYASVRIIRETYRDDVAAS